MRTVKVKHIYFFNLYTGVFATPMLNSFNPSSFGTPLFKYSWHKINVGNLFQNHFFVTPKKFPCCFFWRLDFTIISCLLFNLAEQLCNSFILEVFFSAYISELIYKTHRRRVLSPTQAFSRTDVIEDIKYSRLISSKLNYFFAIHSEID